MAERKVTPIVRQRAQSGRVSYADPTVLHETSRRRVVFVPFFVTHSDRTELAVKIETFRKMGGAEWMLFDEKSVSLQEPAARGLLEALRQHLAVAQHPDDGNYIVLRVSDGATVGGGHDPEAVANAILRVLGQRDIVRHLRSKELGTELVNAFRGAIRLQELRSAVATLRQHLDADIAEEQVYQDWCEQHTWAFGNAYVMSGPAVTNARYT